MTFCSSGVRTISSHMAPRDSARGDAVPTNCNTGASGFASLALADNKGGPESSSGKRRLRVPGSVSRMTPKGEVLRSSSSTTPETRTGPRQVSPYKSNLLPGVVSRPWKRCARSTIALGMLLCSTRGGMYSPLRLEPRMSAWGSVRESSKISIASSTDVLPALFSPTSRLTRVNPSIVSEERLRNPVTFRDVSMGTPEDTAPRRASRVFRPPRPTPRRPGACGRPGPRRR